MKRLALTILVFGLLAAAPMVAEATRPKTPLEAFQQMRGLLQRRPSPRLTSQGAMVVPTAAVLPQQSPRVERPAPPPTSGFIGRLLDFFGW